MTPTASHGAATRRPVFSGDRRVPGLYERGRADGSTVFEAALRLGGPVRRRTLEARTKTDAIAELRALQVDYERGEQHRSPAAALTVNDVADDWIAHLTSRVGHRDPRRRRSARTVALYDQRLRDHVLPVLGTVPIGGLRVTHVRRLVDRLADGGSLASSSMTSCIYITSGLCRFALKGGLLEHNPVGDLDRDDRPGTKRLTEPRYLTYAEVTMLLDALSDTFGPVATTCAYSGLRISEALGLRWGDLDLKAGTLTVVGQLGVSGEWVGYTKTEGSAATVPLLPALVRELRNHRARSAERDLRLTRRDALVFVTSRGLPQSRRNALRALHVAGDKAKLNEEGRERVGCHDLRHSFVALAIDAGLSLPEVCALARHANVRVTAEVYAGLVDNGREIAVAKLAKAGFGA